MRATREAKMITFSGKVLKVALQNYAPRLCEKHTFEKSGAFSTKQIQNLQKEGVQTIAKTKK